MEEWSRKLKLLHWMCIERADGVSPLICCDDGGEGGEGGESEGGDTGGGGTEGGDTEGGEGDTEGGEGDTEGGGDEGDVGDPEGGGDEEGGGPEGDVGDPEGDPESDYGFSDNAGGYADYGGGPDGASGGAGPEAPDAPDPSGGFGPDVPDPNVPDPNIPDPFTPDIPGKEKDSKEKEGNKDIEALAKELQALGLNALAQAPSPMPGYPGGPPVGGTQTTAPTPEQPAGFSFYGPGDVPEGQGTAGGTPGGTGADALGGGNIEQGSGAPGPETSGGGAPGGGGTAGGAAASGGAGTGGAGTETAGLDSGAGSQGGGAPDSQGGGGSGGIQDLFDIPMRAPSARDREQELEREFQQQLAPPTPLPPPPTFTPAKQAGGGIMDAITNALVGSAQAAPVSGRVSQAPIAPGTLPSGAVANPFGNPPTDPNKVQDQLPQGIPGIAFTRDGRGKEKEDDLRDQSAVNIYGMNINTPPGYNTAFSGLPGTMPSAPQGQQVAANKSDMLAQQNQSLPVNPVTTIPFTAPPPPALVATGKGNLQSRVGQGRTDPFGKDAQNPDIFDPNISAPPVGMLMAGVRSGQPPPDWNPSAATPFGPQAPTRASPQVAQGPPDAFGTPGGRLSGPSGQQTPFDIGPAPPAPPAQVAQAPPGPPGVASRTGREGIAPQAPPYDPTVFNPGQMKATPTVFAPGALPPPGPVRVAQAPPPQTVINTGGRPEPPWSNVPAPTVTAQPTPTPAPPAAPPGRGGTVSVATQDARGNTAVPTSYAPDQQAGNPLAGGLPIGAPTAPPNFADFGGGTGPLTQPRQQARQVSEAERQLRRAAKANQDAQAKRDAIAFAMMNRPY